jgi:hypothetical protein
MQQQQANSSIQQQQATVEYNSSKQQQHTTAACNSSLQVTFKLLLLQLIKPAAAHAKTALQQVHDGSTGRHIEL